MRCIHIYCGLGNLSDMLLEMKGGRKAYTDYSTQAEVGRAMDVLCTHVCTVRRDSRDVYICLMGKKVGAVCFYPPTRKREKNW